MKLIELLRHVRAGDELHIETADCDNEMTICRDKLGKISADFSYPSRDFKNVMFVHRKIFNCVTAAEFIGEVKYHNAALVDLEWERYLERYELKAALKRMVSYSAHKIFQFKF